MRLLLLRHGAAEWRSPDAERPLSASGIAEVQRQLAARAAQLAPLSAVYVSPYRRAQQSAALLGGVQAVSHTVPWLTPDSPAECVIDQLYSLPADGTYLLVAHNPLLSQLLNRLLGEAPGHYQLGTSGMAALQLSVAAAGCAELEWLDPGY